MKRLGIAGGLGPAATAYFYETLLNLTYAEKDQDHIDTVLLSFPSVPDRSAYLTGKSAESPLDGVTEILKTLDVLGVDYIAIPCVTIHKLFDELVKGIKTPVINIISETAAALAAMDIKKAGIMATDGTVKTSLFQAEFEKAGIEAVYPEKNQSLLSDIIYDIKAGKAIDLTDFYRISDELLSSGAQINVLGCTELSLLKKRFALDGNFLDTVELLALRSLIYCGARIRGRDDL